jgi:TrmH family RNA methyltransferase
MMTLTKIDELDTPSLTIYRHLRDNASTKDNSFIADGPKVVNMLLQTDIEVRSMLATEAYYEEFEHLIAPKKIPLLYVADKKLMQTIVGHKVHQNVMMHGVRPAVTPLDKLGDNILMCDLISKTENVGSMARSAAALGIGSLVLPKNGPHPYGRRALRVSMGHVSMLDVHLYDDPLSTLETLKADGYKIFAAEVTDDATPLAEADVPKKWVLLMGNEGEGLLQEVLDACDETVQIEMIPGVKSFNVGVAAAILMYQFKLKGRIPS